MTNPFTRSGSELQLSTTISFRPQITSESPSVKLMVAEKGHPRPLRKYLLPPAVSTIPPAVPPAYRQRYPPAVSPAYRRAAPVVGSGAACMTDPETLYPVPRVKVKLCVVQVRVVSTALLAEPILISFTFAGVDELLTEYFYSGRSYQRIVHRLRLVHGLSRRSKSRASLIL